MLFDLFGLRRSRCPRLDVDAIVRLSRDLAMKAIKPLVLALIGVTGAPRVTAAATPGGAAASAPAAEAQIAEGKRVYDANCAACHGMDARGDGPLAGSFDPAPADLVASGVHVSVRGLQVVISVPHYSSELLRERITGGNEPMPAWKDILTREQIDDLVLYVRSLIEKSDSEK